MQRNTVLEENKAIRWQSERVGILYHDEQSGREFWDILEDLREEILDREGQFISLDLAETQKETLLEMFYTALKDARWESSLQYNLPIAVQRSNTHRTLPFIDHAILWQRLCDLLLVDDEPSRETILVLENADQASPAVQHAIARLFRFHAIHSIHRKFLFTLDYHSHEPIIPELRNILGI